MASQGKLIGAIIKTGTTNVLTNSALVVDTNGAPETFGIITNSSSLALSTDESVAADNNGDVISVLQTAQNKEFDVTFMVKADALVGQDKFDLSTDPDVKMFALGDIVTLDTNASTPQLREAGAALTGWYITGGGHTKTQAGFHEFNCTIRRYDSGGFTSSHTVAPDGSLTLDA